MPRPANKETMLKCNHCKDLTPSINPIIVIKESDKIYRMSAYCRKCNNYKPAKILNPSQIKLLPDEIKSTPSMTVIVNQIEKEGGMIPLATLIPLIISGLTALPEIGKTIYNVVKGNGLDEKSEISAKRSFDKIDNEEDIINMINASSPEIKSKILSGLGLNKLGFSINK